MKLTDEQLLDAIWVNQLKKLSKGVIHCYAGGSTGVCEDGEFWYESASCEHRVSRKRVTNEIKPAQLLTRLRKLADAEKIRFRSELIFFIDDERALKAFKDARQFWLDQGVPTGIKNNKCLTAMVDRDAIAEKCEAFLMARYL